MKSFDMGPIDMEAVRLTRIELQNLRRIAHSANNPRELFPETPRGNAAFERFQIRAKELQLPADATLVLLVVTVLAWQSENLSFAASNQDFVWETDLPWNDTLTIVRWLGRLGLLSVGPRVDYQERKDIYFATFLKGIP